MSATLATHARLHGVKNWNIKVRMLMSADPSDLSLGQTYSSLRFSRKDSKMN